MDRQTGMGAGHPRGRGGGRQHWCAGQVGGGSHLVLREQNEACHQDINDVSQTRVLEKFGNLTSKKQERPSLKRGPEQETKSETMALALFRQYISF